MTTRRATLRWVAWAACALSLGSVAAGSRADELVYVGDAGDNTVKRFDAASGAFKGALASPPQRALLGPRGVIVHDGDLLVVNQNAGTGIPGELLRLDKEGRKQLAPLVGREDPHAPVAPRGMVRWRGHVYVADFSADPDPDNPIPGRILKYDTDGRFVAAMQLPAGAIDGEFHPRGIVVGPDDLLYVSNFPHLDTGLGGQILRFLPDSAVFLDVFFHGAGSQPGCGCAEEVNRPEGLVFGPDGRIYMTSFRANPGDTDKVVILNGPRSAHPGTFQGHIELYRLGQPRVFAQALLFGPGGALFVPISNTGGLRRYNVASGSFTNFVPPPEAGGNLLQGWYLSFDGTDPGSLAYRKN